MAHRVATAFVCFLLIALSTPAQAAEVETIRDHLLQVESHLRSVDVSDWPVEQREARADRLDELHRYAIAGEFPTNTGHPGGETPYFIDDHGTACAVGHLMIESGHADTARAIAARENNAYVMEMTSPELGEWIESSGLTPEEAAWIQPAYAFACDELDPIDVSISGPEAVECGTEFDLSATRPPQSQCGHTYAWSIEGSATPEVAPLNIFEEERDVGEFQEWNDQFIGYFDIVALFPENVFPGAYTVTLEVTRENGDTGSAKHELQLSCTPEEENDDEEQPNVTVDDESEPACSSAAGSGFPTGLLVIFAIFAARYARRRDNQ